MPSWFAMATCAMPYRRTTSASVTQVCSIVRFMQLLTAVAGAWTHRLDATWGFTVLYADGGLSGSLFSGPDAPCVRA